MFRSSPRIRSIKGAVLAMALTAALAPAAQAADKSDAVDRHLRNNAPLDVRSPDRQSPVRGFPAGAITGSAISDAVDRYVANDNAVKQPVDFRSADTRDAVYGRYPAASPVLISVPGGGFDWGDATFGAGATVAALLLAGAIFVGLRQRKRIALS